MHKREQIRTYVYSALKTISEFNGNVFNSRIYPNKNLPCLNIYTRNEVLNPDLTTLSWGQVENRILYLTLEIRASANESIDSTLDDLCSLVEDKMLENSDFSGLIVYSILSSTDFEFSAEAEKILGRAILTWELRYYINRTNTSGV